MAQIACKIGYFVENYVYTDFGHDKIIFLKSFLDEYSYNTPYLQHCTDKKTV
jgi:hypothetical protein